MHTQSFTKVPALVSLYGPLSGYARVVIAGGMGWGPRMSAWTVAGFAEQRELGRGASGRVVAAVQLTSGTPVAIKYLAPRLFEDPGFLGGFREEARLLMSLASPHVVRLLDYIEAPANGAAIVMELVNGVSLHEMITRQGPTGPESALLVLKGSLLGLAAAHDLGIVHRDYKPENVLVDADGTSKLTDFGVAVRAGLRASAGGTPFYMAPEQWDGTAATPAADVYAATAVFFECLTGQTPFSGGLAQLAAQHAAAAVPVGLVDEPLRELIVRGMAKDPGARPANALALVSDLEATATAAYGPDWESRGRAQLAGRAAALLLLLLHGPAPAVGGGTGSSTATTTLAPKAGVLSHVSLSGWQLAAVFVVVFAAVAGGVVGVGGLAGGSQPRPAHTGAAAVPRPQPGVISTDDRGAPLNAQILAVATKVLGDARDHDRSALDRLLDPSDVTSAKVVALNKLLAQPGAYQQIVTLLSKTHGASQDGFTAWPGFLLAGTNAGLDAADAKVLGVTSPQDYKGITLSIGDAYDAKPYIPMLSSIVQNGA